MAVIVSDSRNASYNGNLSTANGFYRAESANLAVWGGGVNISGAGFITQDMTFANAGNFQGIALWFVNATATTTRSITVELQENVATVWTTRTSQTKTALEMRMNKTSADWMAQGGGVCVAFKFSTPYAVDTVASKWRFRVTQGVGTGEWGMRRALATTGVFSHAAWCDNKVTYTNNTDQFVAVDNIYLDGTATLAGALFTGDTTNGVSGWICSSDSQATPQAVSKLHWKDAPATSYIVTVTGIILMAAYSSFRAGSLASPIPIAQAGELRFGTNNVGTIIPQFGNIGTVAASTSINSGHSIFIYGEIPAVEDTELESAVNTGVSTITTKVSTGWAIGDKIVIGRMTTKGNADTTVYTIQSISGKDITLTSPIAGSNRAVDASVFRLNGYGFKLNSTITGGTVHKLSGSRDTVISGCECYNNSFYYLSTGGIIYDNIYPYTFSHLSAYTINLLGSLSSFSGSAYSNSIGMVVDHCNSFRWQITRGLNTGNGQGVCTYTNNIVICADSLGSNNPQFNGQVTYSNNKCENVLNGFAVFSGWYSTIKDNKFWGNSASTYSSQGAIKFSTACLNTDISGNYYDNNGTAIQLVYLSLSNKSMNEKFGTAVANTVDIFAYFRSIPDFQFENYTGNITVITDTLLQGSKIRLVSKNNVVGDDEQRRSEGNLYKAGTGLSDTTKHVGNYCIKFVPTPSYANVLFWEQKVPTENIQNKDMMVGVWVNIANAAYWAGACQMPRLTINYDNGTIVYAEAAQATGWQFILAPFTPATTYGEITVSVSGKTAANTTNAVFYVADMTVLYPSGHKIELGAMNTWAGAEPVMPSISTVANAADVWAADPTQFGASTVGDKINKIKSIVTGLQ